MGQKSRCWQWRATSGFCEERLGLPHFRDSLFQLTPMDVCKSTAEPLSQGGGVSGNILNKGQKLMDRQRRKKKKTTTNNPVTTTTTSKKGKKQEREHQG